MNINFQYPRTIKEIDLNNKNINKHNLHLANEKNNINSNNRLNPLLLLNQIKNEENNLTEKEKVFKIVQISAKRKLWTYEEDKKLLLLVEKLGAYKWRKISNFFTDKDEIQCSARYRRLRKGIKKQPWSNKEEERLRELVDRHGERWNVIAKLMKKRSPRKLKEKYYAYIKPKFSIKDFTEQEDFEIFRLQKKYGNKWALIAKYFRSRKRDELQKRFNFFIKTHLKEFGEKELKEIHLNDELNKEIKFKFKNDSSILHENHRNETTLNLSEEKFEVCETKTDQSRNLSKVLNEKTFIRKETYITSNQKVNQKYQPRSNKGNFEIIKTDNLNYNNDLANFVFKDAFEHERFNSENFHLKKNNDILFKTNNVDYSHTEQLNNINKNINNMNNNLGYLENNYFELLQCKTDLFDFNNSLLRSINNHDFNINKAEIITGLFVNQLIADSRNSVRNLVSSSYFDF